jgi:geranylgeranyl diphosphate synthase type I
MSRELSQQIVAAMREAFPPSRPAVELYYAMMHYHLGWVDEQLQPTSSASSGKLLRPLFVLMANRVYGGQDEQALPLAAGIQLLHDFSLIHDDIEDNSPTRRGRPTAWRIWGLAQGINAGDCMFALAHRSIYRLADFDVPSARVLRILRDFEETVLRLCEGQYMDMSAEGQMNVSIDQYIEMIRGKTAALTAASTGLGAQIATDDQQQIAAMWELGEALGLAFQMQDDVLDIWGAPEMTGKPFATDLVQRKMSLPVIHGLAHASADDRAQFEALYRQPELSRADLEALLAILDRTESRTYVESLVQAEHLRANEAFERIEPLNNAALGDLRGIADSLLHRVH